MYQDTFHTPVMVKEPDNFSYSRKKILFTDPDTASFYLISEILSDHDIDIIHAKRGLDAIRLFREIPFIDCLITEIKVPGLDGFGILRATREMNPSIAVIAQTAFVYDNMKHKCLLAGFNEYVSKPLDLELFVKMIRKYVLLSSGRN